MDRIEKRRYHSTRILPIDIWESENDRSKSIVPRIVGENLFCKYFRESIVSIWKRRITLLRFRSKWFSIDSSTGSKYNLCNTILMDNFKEVFRSSEIEFYLPLELPFKGSYEMDYLCNSLLFLEKMFDRRLIQKISGKIRILNSPCMQQ